MDGRGDIGEAAEVSQRMGMSKKTILAFLRKWPPVSPRSSVDMKCFSLDLACFGCYLMIPIVAIFGIGMMDDHVGTGLFISICGPIFSLALATVFQYVGKVVRDGKLDERSNRPLSNLSGTPWEKK